jgi:hypothetical protein
MFTAQIPVDAVEPITLGPILRQDAGRRVDRVSLAQSPPYLTRVVPRLEEAGAIVRVPLADTPSEEQAGDGGHGIGGGPGHRPAWRLPARRQPASNVVVVIIKSGPPPGLAGTVSAVCRRWRQPVGDAGVVSGDGQTGSSASAAVGSWLTMCRGGR